MQPDEGHYYAFRPLKFRAPLMEVRDEYGLYVLGTAFTEQSPEAYERLILDVLLASLLSSQTTREVELSLGDFGSH